MPDSVTLSMGPTLKIEDNFYKANASVTVEYGFGTNHLTYDAAVATARKLLKATYTKTLMDELRMVMRIETAEDKKDLIRVLKGVLNASEETGGASGGRERPAGKSASKKIRR